MAALLPDRARAEAALAERRFRRAGASALCGIPYGVKDLLAARGGPTTWGAPPFEGRIIDQDAAVVTRLRRAGGVLAAKLAMVELAGGGRPRLAGASLQGSGRNPYDPARYSGGSSSGSAIAVAAGLLPYAIGSETGGSIVGPAAFCGITGVRVTHGLVPRTGAMLLSGTLDKLGPLARTADECATVLEAIAGPDGVDPARAGRFRRLERGEARARVRRARVAFVEEELAECEPHTRAALARGLDELRRVAPRWTRAGLGRDVPYGTALETVMLAEAGHLLGRFLERPDFTLVDAKQLAELRGGMRIGASEYLEALATRDAAVADFARVFAEADVIVTVSRTSTAPRLDEPRAPRSTDSMSDLLRAAANLAGLPGVSFPCGLATDGLPVGLQVIGPARSEPLLLAIASAYQRATDHHLQRPAV